MSARQALGITLVALGMVASQDARAVPRQLGYQGRLLEVNGTPIEGTTDITFSFYDGADPTTATQLWSETQTLALTRGFYATQLGSVTPFPEGLFNGRTLYLAVSVDGETLMPLQTVTSVAYAQRAWIASTAQPESIKPNMLHRGGLYADLAFGKPVTVTGGNLIGRGPTSGLGRYNIWTTTTFPSSLELDLGEVKDSVDAIVFESEWRSSSVYIPDPDTYVLEVSEDASTWNMVPRVRPVSNDVFYHQLEGNLRKFRYLRLTVTAPAVVGKAVDINLLRVLSWSRAGENDGLVCPNGWNSAAGGRICQDPTPRGPANMWDAIGDCKQVQARVCTHSDIQQICGAGADPFAGFGGTPPTNGWLGDNMGDNSYLRWNSPTCGDDIDSTPASGASNTLNYFCCL